jgi:lycopene cyclase domain-containing protein
MFGTFSYLAWMLIFTFVAIGILWWRYYKVLWPNRKVIAIVSLWAIVYQTIVDPFAESWHAWFFDNERVLGIWIGNFPIENTIFFVLVAIAISSFVISRVARNKL